MPKKRKRKARTPHKIKVVKVPAVLWEAWNLGFLNTEAEITLTRKFGTRWQICYAFACHMVEKLRNTTQTQLFSTEKVAPLLRMVGSTGVHEHSLTHLPEKMTAAEFDAMLTIAWQTQFKMFFSVVKRQTCEHVSFFDVIETQADHFFKLMKKESLAFVNEMRKSQCPCCPEVSYSILNAPNVKNRSKAWRVPK